MDYLEVHRDEYSQVLVTDTRDVIFQGDVFAPFKNYSSYLGYTTEDDDIRASKTGVDLNHQWLTKYFNKAEADKLADKQIICSGTIIGTVNDMKIFLRTMIKHTPNFGSGSDQVTEQYIIYNNLLPIENLIELDTSGGEIFTSYLFHETHPVETRGDFILRGDGNVPAVVHQYDRQKSLIQLVDRIYRDRTSPIDERFTDVRSVLEQASSLLYADRVHDAMRLCMNVLPDNADFGGQFDRLLKLWHLVLQHPFTPAAAYLELTIQDALKRTQGFTDAQLLVMIPPLINSVESKRAVDMEFKIIAANVLLQLAEQIPDTGNEKLCFYLIDSINALDLSLNKDFYLFVAKANRTFGRNEAALAAYTKALDLS